jgi:hypothetical protein
MRLVSIAFPPSRNVRRSKGLARGDRDREHFQDRDRRGRNETVIVGKDRDHDRDRRPVVIDRDKQ